MSDNDLYERLNNYAVLLAEERRQREEAQSKLSDALKEAAHQTDMANQANVACIGLQSRLSEALKARDFAEQCLHALQEKFGAQSRELVGAMDRLSTSELKLKCAMEAIRSHGNTERTKIWYQHWLGLDVPTTVQYSLSCFLMERAQELVDNGSLEPQSPTVVERQSPIAEAPPATENSG